jgi:hypothetical protein
VHRSSAPTRSPSPAPSSTSSAAPSWYCSRKVAELLEELAELADGRGRVCSSRRGVFAKPSETGPTSSTPWHGTHGGNGFDLYEFAPH